jgi:aspartyl-tRNA(Asn)/glutamyl-tRNA(Gln) amidotransferase subunit C
MAISLDEVEKISKLARLEYADDEKPKLTKELSGILGYVDQLKSLSDKIPDLKEDPDGINLMRDDVAEPVADPAKFLSQAPAKEGDYLKVKSILE